MERGNREGEKILDTLISNLSSCYKNILCHWQTNQNRIYLFNWIYLIFVLIFNAFDMYYNTRVKSVCLCVCVNVVRVCPCVTCYWTYMIYTRIAYALSCQQSACKFYFYPHDPVNTISVHILCILYPSICICCIDRYMCCVCV